MPPQAQGQAFRFMPVTYTHHLFPFIMIQGSIFYMCCIEMILLTQAECTLSCWSHVVWFELMQQYFIFCSETSARLSECGKDIVLLGKYLCIV
jgi:hypothetical protein